MRNALLEITKTTFYVVRYTKYTNIIMGNNETPINHIFYNFDTHGMSQKFQVQI